MKHVSVLYLGDSRKPEKLGYLPGVTAYPGIEPGDQVEISETVCASLNRPTDYESRVSFAVFLCGVYNANMPHPRWIDVLSGEDEPVDPPHVVVTANEPEAVQSVEGPTPLVETAVQSEPMSQNEESQ